MTERNAKQVISEAAALLQTARFGLEDMVGKRPERRAAGFRNAVVFGRNVTWALQNLKDAVPEFQAWYEARQEEMRADPLMKYFVEVRNGIEKQAQTPVS